MPKAVVAKTATASAVAVFKNPPRTVWLGIRLENDLRHHIMIRVRERNSGTRHTELPGHLLRSAAKRQFRFPTRLMNNLNIQPTDSRAPSCSQSFKRCLLGRKARSIALRLVLEAFAIGNFLGSVNAIPETLAVALETLLDPLRLGNIDAWSQAIAGGFHARSLTSKKRSE